MSRMIMSVVRMAGGDQETKDCDSCGKTAVKYITIMFFRFDLLSESEWGYFDNTKHLFF